MSLLPEYPIASSLTITIECTKSELCDMYCDAPLIMSEARKINSTPKSVHVGPSANSPSRALACCHFDVARWSIVPMRLSLRSLVRANNADSADNPVTEAAHQISASKIVAPSPCASHPRPSFEGIQYVKSTSFTVGYPRPDGIY